MKKTILILTGAFLIICASIAMFFIRDITAYSKTPAGEDQTRVSFVIQPGQNFSGTSKKLHDAGLITDLAKFKILARYLKQDSKIKAGEYMLASAMPPREILEILVSGRVHFYKLTIPEGLNIYQVAQSVEKAGICSSGEFLEIIKDPELLKKMEIDSGSLEGYLFPETYHFTKNTDGRAIAEAMVDRFTKVFKAEWKERAKELGFTVHEIVTLASIIEKETGAAKERPLISSVFHNRMKRGMRLETDPTVIYGIKDFNGNLTRKHLRTWTPYNTYKIQGLPPGPIANPGEAALSAALYPLKSKYLYFVSKKDTTHQFSTNIRDHNNAVRKYQLRKRRSN